MRRNAAVAHAGHIHHVPRGWFVLGAALASWMLIAVMWTGTGQLFSFVSSAI